jgi:hypothetical protein
MQAQRYPLLIAGKPAPTSSEAYYVLGLQAFLALHAGVLNPLSLDQGTMPLTADRPIVDEHIRTTFALNEAKAFGIVEPLYIPSLTRRHLNYSGFLL